MYLNKITLDNFRTFYGKHNIEFSINKAQPVTILVGENGAGKTTLLNGVYWAFTGGFTKQFQSSESVINKYAREEGVKYCSVEVTFTNDETRYLLKRIYVNGLSDSDIALSEYDSTGVLTAINREMAEIIIEKLIPKKLASWFFFDGEAIGHLHLNGDIKFRDDLRQTFGFSSLDRLIKTLSELDRDYRKEESRLIQNEELAAITARIESLEEEQCVKEDQLEKIKQTIYRSEKNLTDLEQRLSKYAQAEPIQNRKEIAVRKLKDAKLRREQRQKYRNEYFIYNVPKVLLKNELEKLIINLNQKEEDQTLPEPFGTKLIEDIKFLKKCICGTSVLPGSIEEINLNKMNEKASTSHLMQKIFSFRSEIGEYQKQAIDFDKNISLHNDEIGKCEGEIAEQEQVIRNADQDISEINDQEVKKIKAEINDEDATIKNAYTEHGSVKNQFDNDKKRLSELKLKQEKILSEQIRSSHLRQEREKVARLYNYVSNEFQRQEQEVLNALNKEVSGVLESYLTKNFTAAVEPSTYAVKVFDIDKRQVTLSSGESNLLKFAVIAAIVGMAGKRTKISNVNWISEPIIAPLIFDAPFSVLDKEYRTGVTKNLSELASQLILMFDGDKWNDELADILNAKIGKAYVLVSKAKGAEKLISKNIEIFGKFFKLNEYGERDETNVKEVLL